MGREEQAEEREVLGSIFPEEITDIDEHTFRIEVSLDLPAQDGKDMGQSSILLTVSLPPAYPDTAPSLSLSHPPNASKPLGLDLSTDSSTLLSALDPLVEESLGEAMVFTLVTTLKDSAEQLLAERAASANADREAESRAAEEKENAKFHGEKVTRESFLRWRDAFFAEKAHTEERRKTEEADAMGKKGVKNAAKEEEKLTGKQLWEGGLVGKGWEEDEGDGAAAAATAGVEALQVDG